MWPIHSGRLCAPGEHRPSSRQSTIGERLSKMLILTGLAINLSGCTGFGRPTAAPNGDNGFCGWHVHAPFDTAEVKTVAVFFKTQTFRHESRETAHGGC